MPDGYNGWEEFGEDADRYFRLNALRLQEAYLAALAPPPPLNPAVWAEQARFPEGSPAPGKFKHSTAPYLKRILEVLSPDHPCEEVWIPKCAQSGGTVVGDLWLASILASMNAPCMAVHPTVSQAKEWADSKFWPLIEATPALTPYPDEGEEPGVIVPRINKATGGSKADKIRSTRGGTLLLAGAESPKTLRGHTIRFLVEDDLDAWVANNGEGDPATQADMRLTTYEALGLSKALKISTPILLGGSRSMKGYARSSMERFYLGCLQCAMQTDFVWEDVQKGGEAPFRPYFVCPACGMPHDDSHKRKMLALGLWVPTRPVNGKSPAKTICRDEALEWAGDGLHRVVGLHITGEISRFRRWETIAQKEADAAGDQHTEMVFVNTVLGRPYEIKTKTPGWESLSARRCEDFQRGEGAYGPSVFVLSADVQGYGIWYLGKGYNANEEAWYLEWDLLPGETAVMGEGAWKAFDKIVERGAPLPGGKRIPYDLEVVDSNYNTDAVKAWVRRRPKALAVNGDAGWNRDIITHTHQSDVSKSGKKRKLGLRVWHVGTYPVKSILVSRYGKTAASSDFDEDGVPRGYCWWPINADEPFFRQLTSEFVHDERVKSTNLTRKIWKKKASEENHLFDCDVYNFAGLHHLGARAGSRGSWTEEDWEEADARVRAILEPDQADLFDRQVRRIDDQSDPAPTPEEGSGLPSALLRMAQQNRD